MRNNKNLIEMKTRFFFAALLLLAFGSVKAQPQAPADGGKNVNSVVVNSSGDVTIAQSDQYVVTWDSEHEWHANYNIGDTAVYLDGSTDFFVTLPELKHLTLLGSGDVKSSGVLRGKDLSVTLTGSGDVILDLDYDNVYVWLVGTGDVELRGKCNALVCQGSGRGDLDVQHLQCGNKRDMKTTDPDMANLSEIMFELGENMQQLSDSVDWEKFEQDMEKWAEKMEKWGRKMEKWGERFEDRHGRDYDIPRGCYGSPAPDNNRRPEKKSLLMDPHWNGFEAGLNMLIDPTGTYAYNNPDGATGMEIRPLRSWYFGFNIADVGIAFDRRHTVGMFTGVGIGWNNFSWNNDVRIGYDSETDGYTVVPIESDLEVKNSKYGALFLQAPLMFEVRPTRHMYIDAGVTGGLRIAQWNRIKYENGNSDKQFHGGIGSGVRLLKLDASLRVGAEDLGFFANYALLPLFVTSNAKVHPVSFGFSINF